MALAQLAAVTKLAGMAAQGASASYARVWGRLRLVAHSGSAGLARVSVAWAGYAAVVVVWCDDSRRDSGNGLLAGGPRSGREDGRGGGVDGAAGVSPLPGRWGLSNTAMGAMIGMMAGPWGAAAGVIVGRALDMKAIDKVSASLDIARKAASNSKASLEELEAGFAKAAECPQDTR